MTPAAGSEPGGEERLDDLIAGYFEARKAAIINVVAHKASPPEYPGLALVPVPDIERLEQFVELPRTREGYAAVTPPSSVAERGGLRLDKVRERLAAIYSTVAYNRSAEADKTREVLLIADALVERLAATPVAATPDLRAALERLLTAVNALTGSVTGRDELDGAVGQARSALASEGGE